MKPTLNEKFLAYLALFSGLFLSLVAEYYSILGLTAIFSAAVIPVVIMGIALGLGKVTATLWLKQNWSIAPWTMRAYLFTAIIVLMMVTSMGIFGFLSKAHSDQSLVSGDVQSKIAVYDEKIKTSQDNIDVNRKALKQLDDAVDQVMGRSTSETGADKAVAIRKSQAKERTRLLAEIAAEQKTIAGLREERAPIAAEVRKVEAEVGPIKYIAAFVYGETNEGILEKAVTWVIITLIVVFDPMAVILLLSSQISFQDFRKRITEGNSPIGSGEQVIDLEPPTVTEPELEDELTHEEVVEVAKTYMPEPSVLEKHPYLAQPFSHFEKLEPLVYKAEGDSPIRTDDNVIASEPTVTEYPDMERPGDYIVPPKDITESVLQEVLQEDTTEVKPIANGEYVFINGQAYRKGSVPVVLKSYVQNEEQKDSSLWSKTIYSEKK